MVGPEGRSYINEKYQLLSDAKQIIAFGGIQGAALLSATAQSNESLNENPA